MLRMESDRRKAAESCLRCYQLCLSTAMDRCLLMGGDHIEPQHFRLMMACAEICRSTAHILLMNLSLFHSVCRTCAELCGQCAHSCDRLGDMQDCAEACRACVASCEHLAQP